MTIEERNLIINKAETRKDGVYSYKGYLYAVKDNKFIAFADYSGVIYSCTGAFNVQIGKVDAYDRRKKLIALI